MSFVQAKISLTFQELSEARIRADSRSWRITIFRFRTSSLCRASWGAKGRRVRLSWRRREQMDGGAEGRIHMLLTLRYSESWMISWRERKRVFKEIVGSLKS